MNRPWIAFFSQTGSEIVAVSRLLGKYPDLIITNERPEHLRKIHPTLENKHLIFVDNKYESSHSEYMKSLLYNLVEQMYSV